MATTPPPPSTPRIPPTPRLGAAYDQYEPYSTRYSARIASQRAQRDSTPPRFPGFQAVAGSKGAKKERVNQADAEALSPPGSIHGSPRKKSSGRSRTLGPAHSLQDDAAVDLADPFTSEDSSSQQQTRLELPTTRTNGMLPTPAKTPKKKAVADMGTTARSLFPPMSGRPRKSKKHTGFSLDSFTDDPTQGRAQIQIYTDCRDRIPEVDESEENPFYRPKTETAQTPKNSATRAPKKPRAIESKQEKQLKRDREINDAVKRDDGMVYVFRGKKMFRKFNPVESDGEDNDGDLGLLAARPDLLESSLTDVRPLTRSSIKPRVLFPAARSSSPQQAHPSEVDEEAATDIEDHAKDTDDAAEQAIDPPKSTTAAVSSSPGATTSRSLRPRPKRDDIDQHETTPAAPAEPKRKRISPFDAWQRKKPTPAASSSKTKKREAETFGSPGGPSTKRPRGGRAAITSA